MHKHRESRDQFQVSSLIVHPLGFGDRVSQNLELTESAKLALGVLLSLPLGPSVGVTGAYLHAKHLT